jgi:hypothetical protein
MGPKARESDLAKEADESAQYKTAQAWAGAVKILERAKRFELSTLSLGS